MRQHWIITPPQTKASIKVDGKTIVLENELISRTIKLDTGTISFYNKATLTEFISQTNFADTLLVIDGKEVDICRELKFEGHELTVPIAKAEYTPSIHASEQMAYPPAGMAIILNYSNAIIKVAIRYEIYDKLPTLYKSMAVTNLSASPIHINRYLLDRLAISTKNQDYFYGETNFIGGDMLGGNVYLSVMRKENLIEVSYDLETEFDILPQECANELEVFELLHSTNFYEYKHIEIKQMYRYITPWVLDSPLIFHVLADSNTRVKRALDMAEAAGFDMVIQSFGSGIRMESKSKRYIARHKKLYQYAHDKGLKIGAYTLAIVRNYLPIYSKECNVLADPKGRIFRCLATDWSVEYWKSIFNFLDATNADSIEIDGPYHFYRCNGGAGHLHKSVADSRYLQWKMSTVEVFKKLRDRGIYVNAPDWLFLSGNNKTGIGYEEVAFSQPRHEQLVSSRIYNYKGTFAKIPSMSWSFCPIDVYHGGGAAAKFAPLDENIKDYEWMIFQHFIAGVIPCFRGKKLFNTDSVKAVVKKWTDFYKKYKYLINGNTIHFMPPIMDKSKNNLRAKDIDCILNTRSDGDDRAILGVFNQTDNVVKRFINVPIYFTGLCGDLAMPTPKPNSGIADVASPVYGEYPPTFPTNSTDDVAEAALVTGFGKNEIIKTENTFIPLATPTESKVVVMHEGLQQQIAFVDSNCDVSIEVDLAPMSFTWYIIRKSV